MCPVRFITLVIAFRMNRDWKEEKGKSPSVPRKTFAARTIVNCALKFHTFSRARCLFTCGSVQRGSWSACFCAVFAENSVFPEWTSDQKDWVSSIFCFFQLLAPQQRLVFQLTSARDASPHRKLDPPLNGQFRVTADQRDAPAAGDHRRSDDARLRSSATGPVSGDGAAGTRRKGRGLAHHARRTLPTRLLRSATNCVSFFQSKVNEAWLRSLRASMLIAVEYLIKHEF